MKKNITALPTSANQNRNYRRTERFRFGWILSLMVVSVTARAAVINGVDFTTVYSGSFTPNTSTPAWVASSGGGATATANSPSAGDLTLNTSASAAAVLYYQINNTSIWNASTNSTLEVSMKVDSITAGTGVLSAAQIYFSSGSKDYRIFFTPTSVLIGNPSGTQGSAIGSFATYNMDTTSAFNTYRFVLSGGSLSMYIDNSQTAAVSSYNGTGAVSSNLIYFGDSSSSIGGQTEWNYVAFTNQGAFAPIPEPNALALGLFGILAMVFVHSKRGRTSLVFAK